MAKRPGKSKLSRLGHKDNKPSSQSSLNSFICIGDELWFNICHMETYEC